MRNMLARRVLLTAIAVVACGHALAAPPPEVPNLTVGSDGDKDTVAWDAVPTASTYNLYRGYIHELSADFLGVTLEPETPGTSFSDLIDPVEHTGFFYLVTASNAGGEGTMGDQYVGGVVSERVNSHPWPGFDVAGRWEGLRDWPVWAIHGVLVHTGEVLTWEGFAEPTPVYSWNPTTDQFNVTFPTTDLFCAGHSFLADGSVYVAGGHVLFGGSTGPPWTWEYDPDSEVWTQGPVMNDGRYYPTQVTMGDGRVALFSGSNEEGFLNPNVEIYDPVSGDLDLLDADKYLLLYPAMHLLADGKVFHAGPEGNTFKLDVDAETWEFVASTQFGTRAVLRGDFGSVMLPPDSQRIMNFGGVSPETEEGTNTAEIIDFSDPTPSWNWTTSMLFARDHPDTVILPDGKILAIGGGSDHHTPAYPSEIFDPESETWTVAATMKSQLRGYHSTAVLLPDGRVMSAGGNEPCPCPRTAEFYSPPYLFKGPRPVIDSADATVAYGGTLELFTTNAATIANVVLIRPTAVTHSRNMTQRYVELPFSQDEDRLVADVPANPNEAPPGYYMLFIVDEDGVPSEAEFVRLGGS